MNNRQRLLLVEDDPALAELVAFHFEREGFEVVHTPDGEEALVLVAERLPDLAILDWMVDGVSGIEVTRRLRRRPESARLPIMMLTARGEEDDRVRGLDTGADDYLVKPFSPKELVARARALLRRASASGDGRGALLFGDLELDPVSHRVRRAGTPVHLGPTEYRLLRHFLENPRRVMSRAQLLDAVWPHNEDIELRTVDVHVRRLRAALGAPDPIRTVRAAGYSLDFD